MKRLFMLIALVISALVSSAQIKNNSYLNLGYVHPIANYGCEKNTTSQDNLNEFYNSLSNYETSRYAMDLQIGANFYLHPVNWIVNCVGIGLSADFIDLYANYYRMKPVGDGYNSNFDLLVSYSIGVGPVITFSPDRKFFIDIYGKLLPTVGINYIKMPDGTNYYKEKTALANTLSSHYNDEQTAFCYGLNYSCGFEIRYRKFQVGCEWDFGNLSYDWEDWSKQKLSNSQLKLKLGVFFE